MRTIRTLAPLLILAAAGLHPAQAQDATQAPRGAAGVVAAASASPIPLARRAAAISGASRTSPGGMVVVMVVIAAAAVGGFYLARAIDDSGAE